jgi:hypothetical protein
MVLLPFLFQVFALVIVEIDTLCFQCGSASLESSEGWPTHGAHVGIPSAIGIWFDMACPCDGGLTQPKDGCEVIRIDAPHPSAANEQFDDCRHLRFGCIRE